jgi:hypothetical protein
MEKMHSDDERGKFDLAALVVSKRERERERERRRQRETKRRYTTALSLWWLLSVVGVRVLKFFFFDTILLLMGSSRRRKKKHKSSSSSVRVGKVSQTRQFVAVKSVKLPSGAEHATSENETSWNKETSCVNNYSRNGLVSNANRFYYVGGRNALADNVKNVDDDENANARKRKAADKTLTENADRDELRKAVGEKSSSGIAKPKRLTPRQKRICEMLMSKHGKDVEKMFRDIKANAMQKTRGELKRMLESYEHYEDENGGDRIRVDFRAPKKRLSIKRAF